VADRVKDPEAFPGGEGGLHLVPDPLLVFLHYEALVLQAVLQKGRGGVTGELVDVGADELEGPAGLVGAPVDYGGGVGEQGGEAPLALLERTLGLLAPV
jgi:hypothetical protein